MVPVVIQELIGTLHAAQILGYNLTASLAFLTWDICITIDQEVEFVWMTPGTSWSKILFLFLRYFPFFVLIAIQGVAAQFRRKIIIPLHTCESFFLFQFIAIIFTIIAADIVFMIRVYALYNRQRWVTVIMVSLLGIETVASSIMIPYAVTRVTFNLFCYITVPTHIYFGMSLVLLVPPATSFLFILAKQIIAIRDGWGSTPLMVLLIRDGTWGILGLIGVWAINPLIAIIIGKALAHVSHVWFMSVVPSIGCRVILNMQRLKIPSVPPSPTGVQLTTEIAGFESAESESYQMKSLKPQGENPPRQNAAVGQLDADKAV